MVEQAAAEPRIRPWHLGLLGVLLVALYAPTAAWLWERWTMSVWHNAHGMFIPVVVAWLAWQDLRDRRALPAGASAWGFAFLVPALLLHAVDQGLHTQLLSALSIVILLPGLSLLLLGPARARAIAFPLAFLAFMLPIPLAVTERLHLVLRHVATEISSRLIPLVGIPVYVEETTLHLPRATLVVAEACSGFSTLYAAAAVAVLTAHLCPTWRQRLVVLAAAAPLAIAANALRVVLLAWLVDAYGIEVLEGPLHVGSGMLTFALSLPVIFWLGRPPARGGGTR